MKDLNMINKLFTIVLLAILLYFSYDDMVFYLVCCVGIVILIYLKKYMWILLFIIPIIIIITGFDSNLVSVHNLSILLVMAGFIIIFTGVLTIDERRYVFDKTFYKWRDYKKTKKHLYNCYYDKCLDINLNEVHKYNKIKTHKNLIKEAQTKSLNDLEEIFILNKLRFYQLYSKKRTSFPDKWRRYDTIYLVTMVIICIFLLVK